MPNWTEVLLEIKGLAQNKHPHPLDAVRRKYIDLLAKKTGRNLICYYSGWLQRRNAADVVINDKDKNAFMANIHRLDRSKGLDLVIHTPGGDLAATESIVDYLHEMFGNDIRAIIPQIAMSAGTMIAISCKEILMGKQSNLGPIDPQMGGVPCQAVLDEFEKAKSDIKQNPASAPLWQAIIGKYHPTFLGACQHSIDWSEKLALEWLERNMCAGDDSAMKKIMKEIADHKKNKSHARHISTNQCKEMGLKITQLEDDPELQDLVLTVHHAYIHTFAQTTATKIVENQMGAAYIESLPMAQQMAMPVMQFGQPVQFS